MQTKLVLKFEQAHSEILKGLQPEIAFLMRLISRLKSYSLSHFVLLLFQVLTPKRLAYQRVLIVFPFHLQFVLITSLFYSFVLVHLNQKTYGDLSLQFSATQDCSPICDELLRHKYIPTELGKVGLKVFSQCLSCLGYLIQSIAQVPCYVNHS